MTTARENEILTRVGPGTPMGRLMRQYWVPVALSSEVKPGVDDPSVYRGHRAGNFIAPAGKPFREAYCELIRKHAKAEPRWMEG